MCIDLTGCIFRHPDSNVGGASVDSHIGLGVIVPEFQFDGRSTTVEVDRRNNFVTVVAPQPAIPGWKKMIAMLDQVAVRGSDVTEMMIYGLVLAVLLGARVYWSGFSTLIPLRRA